jgi:uncharacterized membrane protein
MQTCDFCGEKIEGLSHRCRYCGQTHCSKHLLPESHECRGLEKIRNIGVKKWEETFKDSSHKRNRHHSREKEEQTETKKTSFSKKIKYDFSYKMGEFKDWLKHRNHSRYNFHRRKRYLAKIISLLFISFIALIFVYLRADQFNEVSMWIFNLGGILILISLFFALKYGWDLIKESNNLIKRQRRWIKIILFIILLILIWQISSNGAIVIDKAKYNFNKIEFSLLKPFTLAKSPAYSGEEISIPSFFKNNSCSDIEEHATNQYLNSAKYKKNFCSAICGQNTLEYQRYTCDKEDKFHCYCKIIQNE